MKEKKLIHVVGGGFNQVPLVKKAKDMGFRVLVTDMHDEPPAKAFADEYEKIDTTHKEATLKSAERHQIDYILSDMTDVAVPTVAYVAEKLGLPGIGYETALKFTNKRLMRKALESLPQHIPESHFFDSAEDAIDYCHPRIGFDDYIVKPANSQGSKGVFVLGQKNYSKLIRDSFEESAERGILIERYVKGWEYSVETFVKDGKVNNLTLTKKYHYRDNPCLDERNTFLGDVAPDLEKAIFEANEKIIQTMGLPFGMTHAEYKIENGQVYLMEIAARGAGGSISSHIIPYLTEFDTLSALINTIVGNPFQINIKDYKERFAVLRFYNFPPGKVKRVFINKNVVKDLLVFNFDVKEGQVLGPIKDSRSRAGYFVAHGENREAVLQKEKHAESAVQLEYF